MITSDINKKITNIGIFIPHAACPHKCAFCDQNVITGETFLPSTDKVAEIIEERLPYLSDGNYKAEIAFFGGTFTALPKVTIAGYLKTASQYTEKYPEVITGIRCSTRPDCIDEEKLRLLKDYGITAIELGAQSMDDHVLELNSRGHTSAATIKAAKLIKEANVELCLQMMTGLYGDTPDTSILTASEFIKLAPSAARIYPTVIMPKTRLAELYKNGKYRTFSFEETIELCALLYKMFTEHGIAVIRIGLDTSRDVENNMLGGCYHPALGEICEGRYYYNMMFDYMKKSGSNKFVIYSDKKYFSKICGHKCENRNRLKDEGFDFKLKEKEGQAPIIEAHVRERRKCVF